MNNNLISRVDRITVGVIFHLICIPSIFLHFAFSDSMVCLYFVDPLLLIEYSFFLTRARESEREMKQQ